MATAAPPLLSGLAGLLLRRPPSLRELVTLVGYADDYAWFAGLVRRLFPQEAEAILAAPDVNRRLEGFAERFQQNGTSPCTARSWTSGSTKGDEPPWSWLRRGIPFDLVGFGYDDLHEMWDGYREGLSALALLAQPPDSFFMGPDGIQDGLAGIRRRAHPAGDAGEDSPARHTPRDLLTEAVRETEFQGSGPGRRLGLERDRQLLSRPQLQRWRLRRVLRPLGGGNHPGRDRGMAKGQRPDRLGDPTRRMAGGGPAGPLRRDAGLHPAPASRTNDTTGGKR